MKARIIIISLLYLLSTSCNTTKKTIVKSDPILDTNICQSTATMLDYTSNANCQFLFQLSDGTKLLPATMPSVEIPFFADKKVTIGYKILDNKAAITSLSCGAEDLIVEITCIQDYVDPNNKDPKTHEDCAPVLNIFKSKWMRDVSDKLKPQKVFEYDYTVGYLYLFRKNDTSTLYDCLGNKMCDTNDGGDCTSLIETLGKAKLIQVLKN